MSDKGKGTPEVGLGFDPVLAKKYREERLARPSHWSPGVRVQSAEEYDRFTDQLAGELLTTCSPEHLAVIAAQHMMYANELKCVLEEGKAEQVAFIESARKAIKEGVTEIVTDVSITVLKAYRARNIKKRADAVSEKKKDVIGLARKIAAKEWQKDAGQKIKIGAMAAIVFRELKQTKYCKLVASVGAVKRWIKPEAPAYASKPGP